MSEGEEMRTEEVSTETGTAEMQVGLCEKRINVRGTARNGAKAAADANTKAIRSRSLITAKRVSRCYLVGAISGVQLKCFLMIFS